MSPTGPREGEAPPTTGTQAWETPGSSQSSALAVITGAIVGATLVAWAAPWFLSEAGLTQGTGLLQAAVAISAGLGAGFGGGLGWRIFGRI